MNLDDPNSKRGNLYRGIRRQSKQGASLLRMRINNRNSYSHVRAQELQLGGVGSVLIGTYIPLKASFSL